MGWKGSIGSIVLFSRKCLSKIVFFYYKFLGFCWGLVIGLGECVCFDLWSCFGVEMVIWNYLSFFFLKNIVFSRGGNWDCILFCF